MSTAKHTTGLMKHAALMGSIQTGFRDEAIFHCGLGLRHNSLVSEQEANARRLAACWNACIDLSTEELEAVVVWRAACKKSSQDEAARAEAQALADAHPEAIQRFINQMSAEFIGSRPDLVALLKEARKIIRASSSRHLAKDWDRRSVNAITGTWSAE